MSQKSSQIIWRRKIAGTPVTLWIEKVDLDLDSARHRYGLVGRGIKEFLPGLGRVDGEWLVRSEETDGDGELVREEFIRRISEALDPLINQYVSGRRCSRLAA